MGFGIKTANGIEPIYSTVIKTSTLTTKTITQNGTYSAVNDNADGYNTVTVNVPTVPVRHWAQVFDASEAIPNEELKSDGTTQYSSGFYVSDYIDLTGATKFRKIITSGERICFYDENKNFTSTSTSSDVSYVTDIPSGSAYMRFNGDYEYVNDDAINLYYPNGYPNI